jgi:hypothetical protein
MFLVRGQITWSKINATDSNEPWTLSSRVLFLDELNSLANHLGCGHATAAQPVQRRLRFLV